MTEQERVFRYKLDFYYLQALTYLLTLILYGGIRGNFVEQKFEYVLNDPLMYVIMLFVLMSLGALLLNYVRNRRLIVTEEAVIFRNRWHERRITAADMEWIHIGREARVETSGRFQVVVIKIKGKRRVYRIRIGRYERDRELVAEMQRFASRVPKRKRRTWRRKRTETQSAS